MRHYLISIAPEPAGREVEVVLQGPGLREGGKRYVFASSLRCMSFVEAVNFAYEQGRRDEAARRRANPFRFRRLMLVTGRTPDELHLRRERWWEWGLRRLHGKRGPLSDE